MAEYIDRERLKEAFSTDAIHSLQYHDEALFELALMEIDEISAADVVPVVHGSWSLIISDFDENALQCSVCGKELKIDDDADISEYRACPFCTAIMDGGASDERNSS